jgi:hypothetical protein
MRDWRKKEELMLQSNGSQRLFMKSFVDAQKAAAWMCDIK